LQSTSEGPASRQIGLLRSVREERFGETALTFYRWTAAEGDENR
jgi:hypothetical protein